MSTSLLLIRAFPAKLWEALLSARVAIGVGFIRQIAVSAAIDTRTVGWIKIPFKAGSDEIFSLLKPGTAENEHLPIASRNLIRRPLETVLSQIIEL